MRALHRVLGLAIAASVLLTGILAGSAPSGLRGVAEFRGHRLRNLAFTRGVRTGRGFTVGKTTHARMVARYRSDGFVPRRPSSTCSRGPSCGSGAAAATYSAASPTSGSSQRSACRTFPSASSPATRHPRHADVIRGETVHTVDGGKRTLPRAALSRLARGLTS